MPDAWRAYLEMALGLTETTRKRAQKAVGDLVNRGGATAAQLQGLVEDLMTAGMANREALTNIVRYEVDKALGAVGLATAEEVTELTARVRELEKELQAAQGSATPDGAAAVGGTRLERPAPAPKKVAKKAVAKKAVKATPNAMPAAGTTPVSSVAKTAVAKKAGAKKAVAKKAVKKAAPVTEAAEAELPPLTEPVAEALPPAEAAALAELAGESTPAPAPAKKTAAKKAPAKKAPATKAVAKKAVKKVAPTPEPRTEPEA
ncbi:phasin family protein [Actinoplanes subtropicus]|uniref:phasin family protein n=1 Tax=Actinoplanes subtropicus TaxID=543632 RepID=UPI0007C4EA54|nr:hypothetical protein [Actinoplanes subtropicus]